jgi:hypothetical protein
MRNLKEVNRNEWFTKRGISQEFYNLKIRENHFNDLTFASVKRQLSQDGETASEGKEKEVIDLTEGDTPAPIKKVTVAVARFDSANSRGKKRTSRSPSNEIRNAVGEDGGGPSRGRKRKPSQSAASTQSSKKIKLSTASGSGIANSSSHVPTSAGKKSEKSKAAGEASARSGMPSVGSGSAGTSGETTEFVTKGVFWVFCTVI